MNELRRVVKQIVNENTQSKKYYGVFNVHGEYNNGTPLFLITPTKEEMMYKLNYFIENNIPTRNQFQYTLDDFEEDIYMGKKLPHYISDDWCMVTDDERVFKSDLMKVENHTGIEPEEYIISDKFWGDVSKVTGDVSKVTGDPSKI